MKEEVLSLRQKYQTILSQLAPVGAVGVSLALGAAAPAAASRPLGRPHPPVLDKQGFSERLAAVRDAVSAVDQMKADATKAEGRLAWGNWGFGWGWSDWHKWRNWGDWFDY